MKTSSEETGKQCQRSQSSWMDSVKSLVKSMFFGQEKTESNWEPSESLLKAMSPFGQVTEWMYRAGQIKSHKTDAKLASLYVGLVLEEVNELLESIMVTQSVVDYDLGLLRSQLKWTSNKFRSTDAYLKNMDSVNRMSVTDDCLDIIWVANGLLAALAVDGHKGWEELVNSNYSKFDEYGNAKLDATGKVIKPETFFRPDFSKAVRSR